MPVKKKAEVVLGTGQVSEAQMTYLKQQSQHRNYCLFPFMGSICPGRVDRWIYIQQPGEDMGDHA